MKKIRTIWERCLGMLYPQTCCFCGKISKTPICKQCLSEVVYIKEPRCKKCGKPIRYAEDELCMDCQHQTFSYEQGKSVWLHKGNVKWSLYQFKYHNRRIYGEFYARELYRLYGKWIWDNHIDLIIPVPLHPKRRRIRGYNQAEIIADHLGRLTGVKVDKRAIVRKKYTDPQKVLGDKERKSNLKNAFRVTKNLGEFKNILIVDDIYTTGSTIDEIAKTIQLNFTSKVWFLTISIGQGF